MIVKKNNTRKAKYERCVRKVKNRKGKVNPFAVCRSSVYKKKKKKF